MPDLACYRILVAIETDATRYHGAGAKAPSLLAAGDVDQLLAHLATDLTTILPAAESAGLAVSGALLDQTQILRPGYPAFQALERILHDRGAGDPRARLGAPARDGRIEPAALHPDPEIPPGILQLLPIIVSGRKDEIARLGEEMEHRFLEKGQLSPHTARWLEGAFDIATRHARFMTLTDLNAMFRLQLEHFGFLPLWELIDAALAGREEPLEVRTDGGQAYTWRDGVVTTEYQTFDHWAKTGPGSQVESARGKLAGGYAEWTRQLRQYLTTLSAHAIPVRFVLPGPNPAPVAGTYLTEDSSRPPPPHSATVTEHSFSDLGTVCVTVVRDGRQCNHYPLQASGLNHIHEDIRAEGLEGAVAYPGSILYDAASRMLIPDRDEPTARSTTT
ncbi:hypothetical protein [Elongatibacter sediminis]|uniref:Uncharacterized protein n=1 Tax=Elongatibacter sediminis TaxID=3119006 RepID=A0AAW9RHH8_9GAMM